MAQGGFMASYIRKDDKTHANLDANQVALGYTYFLSKRTSLYASVARIHNTAKAGARTGFYRVGNATEQGLGSRAYNFGVRHAF
jgi:predicted porin